MGCQQSCSAIRPVDVYDSGFTGASSSTQPSVDTTPLDVVSLARGHHPPTNNEATARPEQARPPSSVSKYSASSVDSGMGSAERSLMFRNVIPAANFSIDTSLAKSNTQVVSICAQKLNITEYSEGRTDGKPCSIYWHAVVHNDMKNFIKGPDSRVNKFPGMTELAKKIALTHAIRSMRALFPLEYNFYPQSWVLPSQYQAFKEYTARRPNKYYIVKPDEGYQGLGIYLINSPNQLHNVDDRLLVQEYLDDPYLLPDKLKFDFRVYAVIRSINPLSIYIAREGMARFCTAKYEKPAVGNLTHLFSHLTNYSLNKSSTAYVHSNSLKEQLKGSKRLLSTVFHQMESHGLKTRKLWHDVKLIIVKTVLAMVPEIMLNYEHYFSDAAGPQCFQIMGFDIMVKRDGTPVLLEVNAAPSMVIEHNIHDDSVPVRSIVDEIIKVPLIRDTILLVLNQLDDHTPMSANANDKVNNNHINTEDDIAVQQRKRKPHLSEIFPARYGNNSKHLLILDRAVYLFMQFVNIKAGLTMSFLSCRAFLNLTDVISNNDLEKHYCAVNYYFTGRDDDLNSGLPFHGFLQLLFRISWIKFNFCEDQLAALQRLFAFCDSSLRHYGVRSTRLRRAEVEKDMNANSVEIYLLPNRMRKPKSGRSAGYAPGNSTSKRMRARSVQRLEGGNDASAATNAVVAQR